MSAESRPRPPSGRPAAIRIGDWTFSPATASIERGGERRRLEHRAALVLELLCRRAGEPVSAAELVEEVWGGRALSPNSVAVVIADLRRALDDDSRQPRYIETIPKRGYRLAIAGEPAHAPAPAPTPRRGWLLVALLGLLCLAGGAVYYLTNQRADLAVAIGDFPNATGSREHDPLVAAVVELISTELGRLPGVRVVRDREEAALVIQGRVILWTGHPAVGIHAVDPKTGAVRWSGMASGPARMLPRQVGDRLQEFGRTVRPAGADRPR